jgi:hypothetical protein
MSGRLSVGPTCWNAAGPRHRNSHRLHVSAIEPSVETDAPVGDGAFGSQRGLSAKEAGFQGPVGPIETRSMADSVTG